MQAQSITKLPLAFTAETSRWRLVRSTESIKTRWATPCVSSPQNVSRDACLFIRFFFFWEGRSHLLTFFLDKYLLFSFLFINVRQKLLTQLHDSKVLGFPEKSQISHNWQETHRSVFSWRHLWFFYCDTLECVSTQEWLLRLRCTWAGFIHATRGCSAGVDLSLAVCGVALPPHGWWFKTSLDRGQNSPSLLWLQRRHILCFFA